MTFQWLGGDSVLITCKRRDTEDVVVITDPVGPFSPNLRSKKADIVLASFNQKEGDLEDVVKGTSPDQAAVAITIPGEYERKNFFVTGIEGVGSTLYRLDSEDLSIAYLAGATEMLTQEQLDAFEGVHVVMIPAGGEVNGKSLSIDMAADIVRALDPSVVIALRTESSTHPSAKGAQVLAKELGVEVTVVEGGYKLTRGQIIEDALLQLVSYGSV